MSGSIWGESGKVHAALRLLLQERISTAKCLEILEAMVTRGEIVDAPWDEVDWNPANDPGVVAAEELAFLDALNERGSGYLRSTFPRPDTLPVDRGNG